MTPLHWAVQNEHVQICRYLFSSGANPSLLNGHGQSVYEMKTSETVQVLLKNEPTVSPLELEQQLLEAAKNSDIEIIKVKRREEEERERERGEKKKKEKRKEERRKDTSDYDNNTRLPCFFLLFLVDTQILRKYVHHRM